MKKIEITGKRQKDKIEKAQMIQIIKRYCGKTRLYGKI